LAEFETKLKSEKEIRAEIGITKKVIEGVRGYAFKMMLKNIHQDFSE